MRLLQVCDLRGHSGVISRTLHVCRNFRFRQIWKLVQHNISCHFRKLDVKLGGLILVKAVYSGDPQRHVMVI